MSELNISYFYSKDGPERGGIITKTGIVELKNIAKNPYNNYEISFEDMDKLDDENTLGTFHTHPNNSSNLSADDYFSFLSYPRLKHYIYGKQGLKSFRVEGDCLIEED